MKKRILLAILLVIAACALLVGCSGGGGFSKSEPFALAYRDVVGGVEVYATGDKTVITEVEIPSTYNGKKVIGIAEKAFSEYYGVSKISFSSDSNLEYIGSKAFSHSSITSFDVPAGVKTIHKNAFEMCSQLEYVYIPNTVDTVKGSLFYGCDPEKLDVYVEHPTIPSGWSKWYGSNSEFSSDVVFTFWLGARGLEFSDEDYTAYVMIDGTLAISHYLGRDYTVEVPSEIGGKSVTEIGKGAFSGSPSLQSIILPTTLKKINSNAFNECKILESVNIPSGVTYIGSYAFGNCSELDYVIIPNTVEEVGKNIFIGCDESKLNVYCESASVPSGWNKFYGADDSLTSTDVVFDFWWGTNGVEYSNEKYLAGIKLDGTLVITRYLGKESDVVIPESIGGKTVSAIGKGAFYDVMTMQSVSIPSTVKSIESRAFSKCISLASVIIPDSVTEIGSYAFYGNTSLEYFYIPDSVTFIAELVFKDCDKSLLKIYCEAPEQPSGWSNRFASNSEMTAKIQFDVSWGATN